MSLKDLVSLAGCIAVWSETAKKIVDYDECIALQPRQ